mmetsp:Transcript_24711/g.70319  ORF Transcript_24711/g.70319 Transcript_24711/m.70319 type:complete len:220 (-) Transcript_24711:616-1275(-)
MPAPCEDSCWTEVPHTRRSVRDFDDILVRRAARWGSSFGSRGGVLVRRAGWDLIRDSHQRELRPIPHLGALAPLQGRELAPQRPLALLRLLETVAVLLELMLQRRILFLRSATLLPEQRLQAQFVGSLLLDLRLGLLQDLRALHVRRVELRILGVLPGLQPLYRLIPRSKRLRCSCAILPKLGLRGLPDLLGGRELVLDLREVPLCCGQVSALHFHLGL